MRERNHTHDRLDTTNVIGLLPIRSRGLACTGVMLRACDGEHGSDCGRQQRQQDFQGPHLPRLNEIPVLGKLMLRTKVGHWARAAALPSVVMTQLQSFISALSLPGFRRSFTLQQAFSWSLIRSSNVRHWGERASRSCEIDTVQDPASKPRNLPVVAASGRADNPIGFALSCDMVERHDKFTIG